MKGFMTVNAEVFLAILAVVGFGCFLRSVELEGVAACWLDARNQGKLVYLDVFQHHLFGEERVYLFVGLQQILDRLS